MKVNRRAFVTTGVSAAITAAAAKGERPADPNDRIRVGFIGVGGMGRFNLVDFQLMLEVDVVAVCDVWAHNRNLAVEMTNGQADPYNDFREVLDRQDIDVAVISTPDHWHAPIMIAACEAGKDVYIEKPLSHTLREGRKMVEAARRHYRVVQMGTQQRSGAHYQEAVNLIRDGKLGKVTRVHCWNFENETPAGIGDFPPDEMPQGLDWDLYLGPAPRVPFQANRFINTFRWFWDYSGGKITDWGTHHLDIVRWAMNVKGPRTAFAVGQKLVVEDDRETPDTMEVVFEYPGFICTYSHRDGNAHPPYDSSYGIEFLGTHATLFINREGFRVLPETRGYSAVDEPVYLREVRASQDPPPPWQDVKRKERRSRAQYQVGEGSVQHVAHVRNFIDCVRSREKPASDIETGHYSTSAPHLANIALKLGRKIEWDWKKERIIGDAEANRLLTKQYRSPWKV